LYSQGFGVTADPGQARAWYARAAAHGDTDAKKWLADHPQ
jgi:TPR repeat protein